MLICFSVLTDNCNFDFRRVLAVFVDGNNFIHSTVLSFGFIVEELGVIWYVVDTTMVRFGYSLVVLIPCDIWSRLTANFNIDVDGFTFFNSEINEVAAINLRSHYK